MRIKGHQISISLATVQTWVLKDTALVSFNTHVCIVASDKLIWVFCNTHVCTVASDILIWCPLIPMSVP
jgi:hypothetical protein